MPITFFKGPGGNNTMRSTLFIIKLVTFYYKDAKRKHKH